MTTARPAASLGENISEKHRQSHNL